MIKILLFLCFFTFICLGIGSKVFKILNIKEDKFSFVVGFLIIFCLIQLLYYPAQIFNLSFNYIITITLILFLICFIISLFEVKIIIKQLFCKEIFIVFFSFLIFIFIYSKCFIDIDFSDSSTYLNYIVQNVNIDKLNFFNPVNGLYGKEWDILYLYQGYYHFASFLCWFLNIPHYLFNSSSFIDNIIICTWGLGLLYSLFSSFFIVNIVDYFKIQNRFLKYTLLAYLLFYSNFYYWKVAFSFYGNTYRAVIASCLIFYIYRFFKENAKNISVIFPLIIFSGLAFTSSFLFISFAIMFILACYLFMIKHDNTIYDMFTYVFPIFIYVVIMFGKVYRNILIIGLFIIIFIYIGRKFNFIKLMFKFFDELLFKYINIVVYVIVPLILICISLYINLNIKGFIVNYSHYFNNHQSYDMVKDYFFLYSNIFDNFFNFIRWIGIIVFCLRCNSKEDNFIKQLFIISILIFLNPLTVSFLAYSIAGIVYYRLFEVIFNPFTELLIFIYIFKEINAKKLSDIFKVCILSCVICANVFSFINISSGLYTFYINGGKNTSALYKIDIKEVQAIKELKSLVNNEKFSVVSHSNGLRTFIPNAHQIFTPRDYFYFGERVNDEFYEIARRHYSWDSWDRRKDADYGNTCKYIKEYNVKYVILEYWENQMFDNFVDNCSKEYFVGSNYKVRVINE